MKKIKKVTLELSEALLKKIEKAVFDDGFHSRSEFIRFLIMNYIPKGENGNCSADCGRGPAEEVKKDDEEDIFANVDCEYGIPADVVAKIQEIARLKQ